MGSASLKFDNDILFDIRGQIRTGYEGQVKVKVSVSQRPNALVYCFTCVSACVSERTSFGGWDIENGWR